MLSKMKTIFHLPPWHPSEEFLLVDQQVSQQPQATVT